MMGLIWFSGNCRVVSFGRFINDSVVDGGVPNDFIGPETESGIGHDGSFADDETGIGIDYHFCPLSGAERLCSPDSYADLAVEVGLFAGVDSGDQGQCLVKACAQIGRNESYPQDVRYPHEVVLIP
jgi:hypothetical protein